MILIFLIWGDETSTDINSSHMKIDSAIMIKSELKWTFQCQWLLGHGNEKISLLSSHFSKLMR